MNDDILNVIFLYRFYVVTEHACYLKHDGDTFITYSSKRYVLVFQGMLKKKREGDGESPMNVKDIAGVIVTGSQL